MLAFNIFFRYTRKEKREIMKRAEKLIEIEALLENLVKSHREGGFLRKKILFFCSLYQNLTISMIIDKLGIKKTNFALMISQLQKDGSIIIKQSGIDKRCRLVEVTDKGKKEIEDYVSQIEKALKSSSPDEDKAMDLMLKYLNRIV